MKYYFISLNGYGELFKKRLNDDSLFSYARKDNFDTIVSEGKWGYVNLGTTLEKAYYTLFDNKTNFPGEAFIRGWEEGIKEKGALFLGRFMTQAEGKILETDVNLSEKETEQLLNTLSEGGKRFTFLVKNNTPILIFKDNLPQEEVLFPDNIKGLKFTHLLYKKKELEIINNLIILSTSILERHPVNKVRQDLGEPMANLLWIWGEGKYKQMPDIAKKLNKELLYFSVEGDKLPLAEFLGFKRIENIKEVKDNSFIWVHSMVDKKSNYAVWVKKLEYVDREIICKIGEEFKEGSSRILFIFDGFTSPDIEIKNPWVPFLYIPENKKYRIPRKFKDSQLLLRLFLE